MALRGPVTITRNNERFAQLRRELVAHLSAISEQSLLFNEMMHAIQHVRAGTALAEEYPCHWITAFDNDDRRELELEPLNSLGSVLNQKDVEAVGSTVYEWKCNARVIQAGGLADAMADESNPVPLSPPTAREGEQ